MNRRNKNPDMEFDEYEKEILIDFVKKNPPLYNAQHERYKDSELKNRLWEQIGEKLKKSGPICTAKFKNLRDTFMKKWKKIPNSTGSAAATKLKDDALAFVLPHVGVQRESISNITETVGVDDMDLNEYIEFDPATESDSYGSSETSNIRPCSSNSNRSVSSQSPEMMRKKKKLDTCDVLEAILNRPPVIPQPPPVVQDDLSKFLLGLGAAMKTFKPIRLAHVKLELSNIVGKAEIENATEMENQECQILYVQDSDDQAIELNDDTL